jgi:hypothetical protein
MTSSVSQGGWGAERCLTGAFTGLISAVVRITFMAEMVAEKWPFRGVIKIVEGSG